MSSRINWKNHLIEVLIVTLGILIAFGLNNWNNNRNEKQLTNLYLKGLKQEIVDNQKELEIALEYHSKLLNTLETNPEKAVMILNAPYVQDAAWKLSENDIFRKHVNPLLHRKIAGIYLTHSKLTKVGERAADRMSELNVISPYQLIGSDLDAEEYDRFKLYAKRGWRGILQTWVSRERHYLEQIEDVLPLLRKVKLDEIVDPSEIKQDSVAKK